MRRFTLLTLLLASLFGCNTYQYLTLDSSQIPKTDKHSFSWENDTMRLTYAFMGKGGNMNLIIFNKSSQPIYINWKKSALIRDEHSFSLFDPHASFTGTETGKYVREINGVFVVPSGMDFIPPGTGITKDLPPVDQTGSFITFMPDSLVWHMATTFGGGQIKYQEASFDETRSPVRFKSYLTFMLGSENSPEFAETQSFYVSRVRQSKLSPELFGYQRQGDQFFIRFPSSSAP
ncbi:hypothetical protein [Puia dinghuensis]|uniref:Lipoprotein n=1 Tax=Puia dinghuensis TaxID=1792502 RepID=A0A8J2XRV9_9BACT|nr:hypothetical protein [Puia dinghuensis]GGB04668.1 hypothetical protein GCM10011511_29960 [Puia dinghuensis]